MLLRLLQSLGMYFIVFEGLDGSGKSSLMRSLGQHLSSVGVPWVQTREPGGTPLAEELRALILRRDGEAPHPRTELLLYQASRAQHVESFIRPQLLSKNWVLCDRYGASSVAFQGAGRGLGEDSVHWLNDFSTAGLRPHLAVLLDLSVSEARRRQSNRSITTGVEADRMEQEEESFHQRVRQSFLTQAQSDPKNWLVLSAEKSPQELFESLLHELKSRSWLS